MTANRYGYGIHGPAYGHCPNCGAETTPRNVTTPHVGIKTSRCYECCPWWRTSTIPQLTAVLLLFPALTFGFAVTQSVSLSHPVPDWLVCVALASLSILLFRASGPKSA